jgi:hypothetical protein
LGEFSELVFLAVTCLEAAAGFLGAVSEITGNLLFATNMELLIVIVTFLLFTGARQYIGYRNNNLIMLQPTPPAHTHIYLNYISSALLQSNTPTPNLDLIYNTLKNHHK